MHGKIIYIGVQNFLMETLKDLTGKCNWVFHLYVCVALKTLKPSLNSLISFKVKHSVK